MAIEPVIEVTVGAQKVTLLSVEWQVNPSSPCDIKPLPSSGDFTVLEIPIEIDGSKFWIEYKTVTG